MRRSIPTFALFALLALPLLLIAGAPLEAQEVVTGSVLPGVSISSTTDLVGGVRTEATARLPQNYAPITYANGTGAYQVNKKWIDKRTYSGSATTLDLTTLAGATTNTGAASFASVKVLAIYNGATTAGHNLTVFNAASVSFQGPLSTSATVVIGPGESAVFYCSTAAGWACSTNKNLKIDPGANSIAATVVIAGN